MNDPLVTMQSDLERALSKPADSRRWGMLIDQRKCVGCNACVVGCMAENVTPPALQYKKVFEGESGKYPNVKRMWMPNACNQCSNPPCVPACPVDATKIETKGVPAGIVTIDYKTCIGCGSCVTECPYNARKVDEGDFFTKNTINMQDYEKRDFFEYGQTWNRGKGQLTEKARKCHFCINRLEAKALPTCVTTCIGRATYFGDLNDSSSLIAQVLKSNSNLVLLPKSVEGSGQVLLDKSPETKPNLYYIVQR